MTFALVIGAGPAGLAAAEVLSGAGHRVIVAEAKPSVARKFLMAGKSGLNLTRSEDAACFVSAYGASAPWLAPMLEETGPMAVMDWAEGLGQPLFTGSTGRVFPKAMKASPLLRAWLGRLGAQGVEIVTRWRWTGWRYGAVTFDTPDGPKTLRPAATVLALGGASWPRLGSDGAWAGPLRATGIEVVPFRPANAGLRIDWSPHMEKHFGQALKAVAFRAGPLVSRGEAVISARGLEGGGIYQVFGAVRDGHPLTIDLIPDLDPGEAGPRFAALPSKLSRSNRLRRGLKLDPVRIALVNEFGVEARADPVGLVHLLKAVPVPVAGLAPIAEAISTAGGVPREMLDDGLMLKALPGTFCAGEMLDWEAPTGGYLLTGCFATGRHAGRSAAAWIGAMEKRA